jgi:hypothetical protein
VRGEEHCPVVGGTLGMMAGIQLGGLSRPVDQGAAGTRRRVIWSSSTSLASGDEHVEVGSVTACREKSAP